jgi:hypothetical protein
MVFTHPKNVETRLIRSDNLLDETVQVVRRTGGGAGFANPVRDCETVDSDFHFYPS